ncbi:MAG: hypothetical protein U0Z26_05400 [Anaerolineales bacterium]
MTKIILLDIDGVLVQPGGYRAALRATVNYFLGKEFEVPEDILTDLEKRGISSEWDMAPLIIASHWNSILLQHPQQNLPEDISVVANELQKINIQNQLSIPEFDLVTGQYPAEAAFHAECFSSIPLELRKKLLTQTRDIQSSPTMRIFQHFTLGSENFSKTYHLPAEFKTESLLLTHDQSNINDEIRVKLRKHHLAAFTARPSGPPTEVTESIVGYAPEAELALDLVKLQDIPLIAFGKLEYLASQHEVNPATLVKPSPIQALAATLAAWTGDEWASLQAANQWRETGSLGAAFKKLPSSFELLVVEDTMGGIRSVRAAGEILQKAGFLVQVYAIGLTSGISAKAAAFETAGIPYFENWESLIAQVGL